MRIAGIVLSALLAVPALFSQDTSRHPSTQAPAAQGSANQNGSPRQPYDPNSAAPPNMPLPQAVQPAPNGSNQLAANTEIHAVLDTPLSVKTSKPGDRFTATIADPVRGTSGAVVIPPGAHVEGEVAEADSNAAAALKSKGGLSLHFRDVVLSNGQTFPLAARLISVHTTSGMPLRQNSDAAAPSSDQGRKAIGAGSTFGAPIHGLAIGSYSGGGFVVPTKGKDVELPAETGLLIRLDRALTVSASSENSPR